MLLLLLLAVKQSSFGQAVKYTYEVRFEDKQHPDKKKTKIIFQMHSMLPDKVKRVYQLAQTYNNQQVLEDHLAELGFKKSNGKFQFEGRNGMGVILRTEDNALFLITHEDGNWNKRYEGWGVKCSSDGEGGYKYEVTIDDNSATNEDVNVIGDNKYQEIPPRNIDLKDGYDRFECHIAIPDSFLSRSARIIIRPYAIDCQTEDTIAYLKPASYEGEEYHRLQDKRKAFDYHVNDPVGMTYYTDEILENIDTFKIEQTWKERVFLKDEDGKPLLDEDGIQRDTLVVRREIVDSLSISTEKVRVKHSGFVALIDTMKRESGMLRIDTTIVFRRPIKSRRNRGLIKYTVEDYHHEMKRFSGFDPGTCLSIDPFKFLEMSTAMIDFELRPEFYEVADETPDSMNQEIPIQFYYNTANIIEDSIYMVSIRRQERDMRDIIARGGILTNATITAYASPDGPPERNMLLARQRAQAARGKFSNIPGGSHVDVVPKIDSWQRTAELLEKDGHLNEAQIVRDALASTTSNKAAEGLIKNSSTYKDIIKPILEKQCRITFSYQYFSERKLEPEEALEYYYKDKHRVFSNGDYYNMFEQLIEKGDTVELDTLTEIAYKRLIEQNGDYTSPIAPYIINRKAVLNAKQGILDSTVLSSLIYEGLKTFRINYRREEGGVLYNRPEILLNQAVILFQLQEIQRAKMFINRLRRSNFADGDGKMEKLNKFINFQTLYQIAPNRRTRKQQSDFNEAMKYIESIPGNKAVLYTEFDGLKKQQSEAWDWVHLMDDNNPRKWYLMGILWALRDGHENEYPLPISEDVSLTDTENPIMPEDEEEELKKLDMESYNAYLLKKQRYLQRIEAQKASMKQKNVVDADVNVEGIPYYLAYFWKSFDMENERLRQAGVPEDKLNKENIFMKYYFNEGYVNEKMRKKKNHAFKMSRIPAYRKLFRLRKIEDDKERAKVQEKYQLDIPAEGKEDIILNTEFDEQDVYKKD
ncbi:hypothetical protein [uncultured Prevotella sp.]|uniref:hypothetical protein n=1 Tax=uncultured Prevotella sp. TaxID=159272 RepID=UPI00258695DF|nr:hypothetical protein [uncultured Prevotella sp.]